MSSPYLAGSNTAASGSTLTVTAGSNAGAGTATGLNAGDTAVVAASAVGGASPSGATDSAGDTYTAGPANTTSPASGIWYALASAGLASGTGTATADYSGSSGAKNAVLIGVPGATSADTAAAASGAGTVASGALSLTSGALAQQGEVLIGIVAYGSTGGGSLTWGTGWTPLATPFRTGSNEWLAAACYSAGASTAAVTLSVSGLSGTPAYTAAIQPFRTAIYVSGAQAIVPVQSAAMRRGRHITGAQVLAPQQSAALVVTQPPPPAYPQSPIDLGAQMLLSSAQVTGTPGAIGATVGASTYPPWTVNGTTGGTADSVLAARKLDGYAGLPLALAKTRWYVTETEQETGYTSLPTGLAGLIAAGAGIQCCVRPSRAAVASGGSTLTAAQTSLASFLGLVATACAAAGTPLSAIDVTVWTECNDVSEGFFPYTSGGATVTYPEYWAAYAPTVLGAGFSACYNPAGNGASYPDGAAWFTLLSPTPSKLYIDQYCNVWAAGVRLDEPYGGAAASYEDLADGAGIPIGLGEYGLASGNPASPPSSTVWGEFISWLISFFSARLQQGKTNADILFFGSSNPGSGSPEYNSIQSGTDFKTGLASVDGIPIPGLLQMAALAQPLTSSGSQWQDISSYVYQRGGTSAAVTISRGRPNESSQATPSSASCDLNNRGGDFTASDPGGQWYGQFGRNTPIRFSVAGQTPYLRMEDGNSSCAACPDAAALDITASTDIRIDVTLTGYQAAVLASKWTPGAGITQNSWLLQLNGDGTLILYWSQTGSDVQSGQSTMPIPAYGRVAARVTLNTASGAVKFYTAPTMTGTWTQLGLTVGPGSATEIYDSDAPVSVGNYGPSNLEAVGPYGAVHEFRLYSGIAGTLVADPVFSAQAEGTTSFADAQGNTWTLYGTAEISQRSYRFFGEMSSLPKASDPSLTDVHVPLTAGGILRRLQQGNAPEYSPMRRALQTQAGALACVAYWPGEDLQGSTAIGSAIGGPLMTFSGGTGDGEDTLTGPAFASDSSFACSDSLLVCNNATMHGVVPVYTSSGSVIVRFLMNVQDTPASEARIMRVIMAGGTVSEFSMYYTTGGNLGLAGYNQSGTVFDTGPVAFNVDSNPVWVSMELRPSGGTVDYSMVTLQPGASEGGGYAGTYSGSIGRVTDIYPNPQGLLQQVAMGHFSVQSAWESLFSLYWPLYAWNGELAANRYLRLCGENNIPVRIYGPPDVSAAMGAQPVDTLPDLLQACETADMGMICEPRQAYALGYRTLASMLNQAAAAVLDWSAAELASQKFSAPTDDDQYTINDVTATRESGGSSGSSGASYRTFLDDGSAMSISPPPDGVGDYATSASVNAEADTQLPDVAGWMVHRGTVDEPRWPSIPVDLARPETAALFYGLQEINIGDYIQQVNLPSWLTWDDVRQIAAGTQEEIGGFIWRIAWNGIPESPYETGICDDPVYGRADTDGATAAAAVDESATTLLVATTNPSSPLWTTASGDFPFDISVKPPLASGKGERMTVTGITGTSSPQTFTVIRSVNGVVMAHQAGEAVALFYTPIYAVA